MGQLIKLENYISRYQNDVYHYPGHYIRLKQEKWKNLFDVWEARVAELQLEAPASETTSSSFIDRLNDFFKKDQVIELEDTRDPMPATEEQLKHFFLDSIFKFQLNWASTTLSQMSFLDRDYYNDLKLKYFL